MWQRSYSMTTQLATESQIWATWADINHWSDWDDAIEYAQTLDPFKGSFQVGTQFILKPKGGPKVKIEIVECIPGVRFIDLTRFPLAQMWGKHEMERTPEGLKLTTTMSISGPLAFLWRKLVCERIVEDLPLNTQKLIESASKR